MDETTLIVNHKRYADCINTVSHLFHKNIVFTFEDSEVIAVKVVINPKYTYFTETEFLITPAQLITDVFVVVRYKSEILTAEFQVELERTDWADGLSTHIAHLVSQWEFNLKERKRLMNVTYHVKEHG